VLIYTGLQIFCQVRVNNQNHLKLTNLSASARTKKRLTSTILECLHSSPSLGKLSEVGIVYLGSEESGLSEVWARFLGTTAEKVSRHAACCVLIVR
jgi:hypothetical protein